MIVVYVIVALIGISLIYAEIDVRYASTFNAAGTYSKAVTLHAAFGDVTLR